MCYLLEAGKGIIPKWDEFYTRFKAANDFLIIPLIISICGATDGGCPEWKYR